MPKYELMYLLGSHVADTDVPGITAQVLDFVKEFGGEEVVETQLGKKKLAYPIKKTRNGHYVVVNFSMEGKKVNGLDAKIRSQNQNIIRYILVNLDEYLERAEKDRKAQSALNSKRKIPASELEKPSSAPVEKKAKPQVKLEDIDEKALEEKIEAALTEDLTK